MYKLTSGGDSKGFFLKNYGNVHLFHQYIDDFKSDAEQQLKQTFIKVLIGKIE